MAGTIETAVLAASLLFYAGFDASFDAAYSKGASSAIVEQDRYAPRLTENNGGRFGEAVSFSYDKLNLDTVWTKDCVRYSAQGNFPASPDSLFDGTIGMWVIIDMKTLLKRELIWLDPFHLLSNDKAATAKTGKIWMDFVTKELDGSPLFRFGAILPEKLRKSSDGKLKDHVITVPDINFSRDDWHHIVGTWKNLNNTNESGELKLYFDGKPTGSIEGFSHPLALDTDEWEMRLGIGFQGLLDEFFVLDRQISNDEVAAIYSSSTSLGEFLKIDAAKTD